MNSKLNYVRLKRSFVKIIVVCFAALFSFNSLLAQSSVSENWSKPNLLGSDTVWKFRPGIAQPENFSRDFSDEGWQSVSNQFLNTIAPNTKAFQNIGVFRRKFYVPDSVRSKPSELFFNHVGACEIYFDGRMVFKAGTIVGKVTNVVAFQRSIPLILDSLPWHVLAVYYASTVNSELTAAYGLRGFGITLISSPNDGGDHNGPFHHLIISLGIIAGFALFFWFVFFFYPTRTASLLSALMLTNFSLIFLGSLIRDTDDPALSRFVIGEKLWEVGFSTTYGWLLLFVYSIFYKKMPRHALLVAAGMCTSIAMIIFRVQFWFTLSVVFLCLYVLELWRMIITGLVKRKTGFWILAIGLFLSNAGTLSVIFNVFNLFPWYLTSAKTMFGIATDMCFPLTLALHLAWEFGSANRDLRLQLSQVSDLSEKTLRQEQEKQQILATQNETLEEKVTQRTAELNQSLQELKATQAQLVQREKMASLGELTAGIAHEIQNPLNFVNNFSEVSVELIDDLKIGVAQGNDEEVISLANEISDNLQKVVTHGKRADGIVKGMLQHSRASTGEKQPTDINQLADEYLRLSYQAMRSKNKLLQVQLATNFDQSIGNVSLVPQDIGRVLLNLFQNAFYAVDKKKERLQDSFQPLVIVSTKHKSNSVEIEVSDNGDGIPPAILGKIFQPFFTTKPTGEGTGLGLSLSYDIVTKGHGGELSVSSKEGEGSRFLLRLPTATK